MVWFCLIILSFGSCIFVTGDSREAFFVDLSDGSHLMIRGITVGTNHQFCFDYRERWKSRLPRYSLVHKLLGNPPGPFSVTFDGTVLWSSWTPASPGATNLPHFDLRDGTNGPIYALSPMPPQYRITGGSPYIGAFARGSFLPHAKTVSISVYDASTTNGTKPIASFWLPNP